MAAAMTLARAGRRVVLLEADGTLGGLAGTFEFGDGVEVEKFYHHWFTNDRYVPELVAELGMSDDIVTMPSRTGMYLNGRIWSLSTPLDLMRFSALSFPDRVRLGLATLRVRRVEDWRAIEHLSIAEWLAPLCGQRVYERVWEPLVSAKFGKYADEVSAAWMWKKLVLRGSTRRQGRRGAALVLHGGFGRLAAAIGADIESHGGTIRLGSSITGVTAEAARLTGLRDHDRRRDRREYLFTPSLASSPTSSTVTVTTGGCASLRRVNYLGQRLPGAAAFGEPLRHVLVERQRSGLSVRRRHRAHELRGPTHYGGDRIVYLSRYLDVDDPVWAMDDDEYLDYALGHLRRMFPKFERGWIREHRTWRTRTPSRSPNVATRRTSRR